MLVASHAALVTNVEHASWTNIQTGGRTRQTVTLRFPLDATSVITVLVIYAVI